MNYDSFDRLKLLVASLHEHGITTEWQSNESSDKPSAFVDAQSSSTIGRITVWASNEWDFEVISTESEETTLSKYLDQPDDQELIKMLDTWKSHMLT